MQRSREVVNQQRRTKRVKRERERAMFFGLGLLLRIKKPNQQTDQPTTKAAVKSAEVCSSHYL